MYLDFVKINIIRLKKILLPIQTQHTNPYKFNVLTSFLNLRSKTKIDYFCKNQTIWEGGGSNKLRLRSVISESI